MLSPEVDALRKAAGIMRDRWEYLQGTDDHITKLVELAKAERDAELRKQEPEIWVMLNDSGDLRRILSYRFDAPPARMLEYIPLYAEPMPPAEPTT